MKKFAKILCSVIAVATILATSIAFTGCSNKITLGELSNVAAKAAKNYYKERTAFDNFKDTEYTSKMYLKFSNEKELSYLKNEDDAELTTEDLTEYSETNANFKLYIKNIDEETLGAVITVEAKSKTVEYSVNASHKLETTTTNTATSTKYILSKKDNNYYLVKTDKQTTDGEVTLNTKQYKEFQNKDNYIEEFEKVINHMNTDIIKEYFFDTINKQDSMINLAKVTKFGKKVTVDINATEFNINDETYDVRTSKIKAKVIYKNNKINNISMTTNTSLYGSDVEVCSKLSVKNGAEIEITIPELTDYNEYTNLTVKNGDMPMVTPVF